MQLVRAEPALLTGITGDERSANPSSAAGCLERGRSEYGTEAAREHTPNSRRAGVTYEVQQHRLRACSSTVRSERHRRLIASRPDGHACRLRGAPSDRSFGAGGPTNSRRASSAFRWRARHGPCRPAMQLRPSDKSGTACRLERHSEQRRSSSRAPPSARTCPPHIRAAGLSFYAGRQRRCSLRASPVFRREHTLLVAQADGGQRVLRQPHTANRPEPPRRVSPLPVRARRAQALRPRRCEPTPTVQERVQHSSSTRVRSAEPRDFVLRKNFERHTILTRRACRTCGPMTLSSPSPHRSTIIARSAPAVLQRAGHTQTPEPDPLSSTQRSTDMLRRSWCSQRRVPARRAGVSMICLLHCVVLSSVTSIDATPCPLWPVPSVACRMSDRCFALRRGCIASRRCSKRARCPLGPELRFG